MIWRDAEYSYSWLAEKITNFRTQLKNSDVVPGSVVSIESNFQPEAIALFFALSEHGCIIAPLTPKAKNRETLLRLAQVQFCYWFDPKASSSKLYLRKRESGTGNPETHPLYTILRRRHHPGLLLFSSGTTGAPKAALHDLKLFFDRFNQPRHPYRAIAFLMFDHIGGLNTMLYILSSGGCLTMVQKRSPEAVLQAVEKHRVELLPASPTFLNMILLSEAYQQYELNSLKVVSYGTEPMAASTLKRFHQLFPEIRMQQTYGLSEIGIPGTRSKASDSLWLKISGEGVETRVVNGVLHIRSKTAMLGYLNAPSPFTEDGWLNTGDAVETDGEYIRFLGREDSRINVGGEKVYPSEIENVLMTMEEVADARVYGEKNLLTGAMAAAEIEPAGPGVKLAPEELRKRIRNHCQKHLSRYKVPARITIVETIQRTERGKKERL